MAFCALTSLVTAGTRRISQHFLQQMRERMKKQSLWFRSPAIHVALVSVACAAALPVHAAIDCTGTITNLSLQLSTAGTVTLSLSSGPTYTYLCDISDAGRNGVAPTVCKAMYATLLTAKATNKRVLIRFNDYSSCSAVPAWADAGSLGWTQVLID